MRKLFVFMMILVLLLALGCAKRVEPIVEVAPTPMPDITQVNPGAAEQPAAPQEPASVGQKTIGNRVEGTEESPAIEHAPYTEGQGDDTTIGTRVLGTERTDVNESVPAEGIEISLNSDKTMNMTEITIPAGTTLFWKNYDSWPHVIAVDSGSGFETKRWGKSDQLLPGGVWAFTFRDKGTFVARDMFSGAMRMNVTVE